MCLQHEMDHLDGILYYDHFNKDNPLAPIPNAMVIE
jgi:peptide deformylase